MSKRTIAFDVCGTLYRSNTTFDYAKYYFSKKSLLKYFAVLIYTSIFGKVLHKLTKFSIRNNVILLFKGEPIDDVKNLAKIFVDEKLSNRKVVKVFDLFEGYLKSNDNDLILLSASMSPIVSAIANKYGIDFRSTELEEEGGFYTGLILNDMRGMKNKHCENADSFYSDNIEDLVCSFLVKDYYYISHKYRKEFNLTTKNSNVRVIDV